MNTGARPVQTASTIVTVDGSGKRTDASRHGEDDLDAGGPQGWHAVRPLDGVRASNANVKRAKPLYTPDEQRRRDETVWTLVQGILAPVQFIVFLVSFALVVRFLATGEGWLLATLSVIFKTLILYTIMITGSVWEKVVFGKYLFAGPFFWEDVVSILVLALHTAYLAAVIADTINRSFMDPQAQMLLALAAYAAYVINAAQFLLKLRAARLQRAEMPETALALQQVNTSTVTGQLPGVSS